jgi:hypothetical protein
MNPDDMTPEQAVWAYSSMLHDSRQERDSLRREINIIIQQYTEMTIERNRWKQLCELFEEHYQCNLCEPACATYLIGCMNPLHAIHDALWGTQYGDRQANAE